MLEIDKKWYLSYMNDIIEVAIGNNMLNIVKYICKTPENYRTGYAPTLFPAEVVID